jgi:hypothetical protein
MHRLAIEDLRPAFVIVEVDRFWLREASARMTGRGLVSVGWINQEKTDRSDEGRS